MTAATADRNKGAHERNVDAQEIERFAQLAQQWWDTDGPMGQLHALNPARMVFIRAQILAGLGLTSEGRAKPFAGLRMLDIGCGAGIVSEPLARLGASVTAVDAAAESIDAARIHAEAQGLSIDYHNTTVDDLGKSLSKFDAVTVLEIVEHVPDPAALVTQAARRLRPGGVMILSTLNRTPKSFALAKIAAEYVLRWVPVGTHDWRKFLKPSELSAMVRDAGLTVDSVQGLSYRPIADEWRLNDDVSINYLMAARKLVSRI